MDVHYLMVYDLELSTWLIKEYVLVIFHDNFVCPMDVCPKYWEGKLSFLDLLFYIIIIIINYTSDYIYTASILPRLSSQEFT